MDGAVDLRLVSPRGKTDRQVVPTTSRVAGDLVRGQAEAKEDG
jgi:hypothetical protein